MVLMNLERKNQIIALVRARPGIRTVEIADALDFDFDAVEVALVDLVAADLLLMHSVKAPNGRDAMAFTARGVALPAVTSVAPAAAVPAVYAAALAPKPAQTKAERAIEFINANGGVATSAELHTLLGLKSTDYASSYLLDATASGRLVKDGKNWTVGIPAINVVVTRKTAATAPAAAPVVPTPAFLPAAVGKVKAAPVAAPAPPAAAPTPIPAPPAASAPPAPAPVLDVPLVPVAAEPVTAPAPIANPKISYALWSNGSMHFARDGETVLMLRPADVKGLFSYLEHFTKEAA